MADTSGKNTKDFRYFIDVIPSDLYSRTKSTICRHIAIFEPERFTTGEVICIDDYHFILFFSEAPITRIDDRDYHTKKGSLLVVEPWQKVYGLPNENVKQGKYIHIAVNKDFFRKVAAETAGGKVFQFIRAHHTYSEQVLDLIGNLQREIMNHGETCGLMVESICAQLVIQLIRDLNAEDGGNINRVGKDNPYIDKAIEFMQEYYSANIKISDICNLIYLSPSHFKRVFKESTGQTPYQYLMEIRLHKAKELLRKKEHTMEEVARMCGFVNSGHFSTVFKRNMNMSPKEYWKKES